VLERDPENEGQGSRGTLRKNANRYRKKTECWASERQKRGGVGGLKSNAQNPEEKMTRTRDVPGTPRISLGPGVNRGEKHQGEDRMNKKEKRLRGEPYKKASMKGVELIGRVIKSITKHWGGKKKSCAGT